MQKMILTVGGELSTTPLRNRTRSITAVPFQSHCQNCLHLHSLGMFTPRHRCAFTDKLTMFRNRFLCRVAIQTNDGSVNVKIKDLFTSRCDKGLATVRQGCQVTVMRYNQGGVVLLYIDLNKHTHLNSCFPVPPHKKIRNKDTPREYTRDASHISGFLVEILAVSQKAKYARMRTLPDPFGIPSTPRSLRPLVRDGLPGFYPPVLQPAHDARISDPSGRRPTDGTRQRW